MSNLLSPSASPSSTNLMYLEIAALIGLVSYLLVRYRRVYLLYLVFVVVRVTYSRRKVSGEPSSQG